ncbi:hypothetical protein BASA81_001813 [Batrachochytrium salamandrivorans]|nr:hypothetical protein BASA81_001813 [Batrachochytrium salamandrivorans]
MDGFKTAKETFSILTPGLNRDSAGSRTEQDLPRGNKEFQLYSLNTPNGQKVGIALEEFGLEYDAHVIQISKGEQFTSGFVDLNPNARIPALLHQPKKGGEPVKLFESGAILLYLGETYGKFFPPPGPKRAECYSWIMWQMGGQGPMFGQMTHFLKAAPKDKSEAIHYGVARYSMETRRLLSVMENHLQTRQYLLGDEYSIADMCCYPWPAGMLKFGLGEFIGFEDFPSVRAWLERVGARPAVQRGLQVCSS